MDWGHALGLSGRWGPVLKWAMGMGHSGMFLRFYRLRLFTNFLSFGLCYTLDDLLWTARLLLVCLSSEYLNREFNV
jgi:hypothetical protein